MAAARMGRLRANGCALFVCDVQEKFRGLIHHMPAVIETTSRMVRAANVLDLPVFVTEQYPKVSPWMERDGVELFRGLLPVRGGSD